MDWWGGRLACHWAEGPSCLGFRSFAATAGETPAPPI